MYYIFNYLFSKIFFDIFVCSISSVKLLILPSSNNMSHAGVLSRAANPCGRDQIIKKMWLSALRCSLWYKKKKHDIRVICWGKFRNWRHPAAVWIAAIFVQANRTGPLSTHARPQAATRYLRGRPPRRMGLFKDHCKATQIKKGNTAAVIVGRFELWTAVEQPERFILMCFFSGDFLTW